MRAVAPRNSQIGHERAPGAAALVSGMTTSCATVRPSPWEFELRNEPRTGAQRPLLLRGQQLHAWPTAMAACHRIACAAPAPGAISDVLASRSDACEAVPGTANAAAAADADPAAALRAAAESGSIDDSHDDAGSVQGDWYSLLRKVHPSLRKSMKRLWTVIAALNPPRLQCGHLSMAGTEAVSRLARSGSDQARGRCCAVCAGRRRVHGR
jgi:hypothetical protein